MSARSQIRCFIWRMFGLFTFPLKLPLPSEQTNVVTFWVGVEGKRGSKQNGQHDFSTPLVSVSCSCSWIYQLFPHRPFPPSWVHSRASACSGSSSFDNQLAPTDQIRSRSLNSFTPLLPPDWTPATAFFTASRPPASKNYNLSRTHRVPLQRTHHTHPSTPSLAPCAATNSFQDPSHYPLSPQ